MAAIKGVVTRAGRTLAVRLESGLCVETTNDYGFGKYDRVLVRYDFTRAEVVGVEPMDRRQDESDVDEPVVECEDGGEACDILPPLIADSGALYLFCDEGSDAEVGMLELGGESHTEHS